MTILIKALRLLLASPLSTLKVLLVPGLVALILIGSWLWSPRAVGDGDVLVYVAPGLILLVCAFWAAAAWHRFVLLDGAVGWVPSVPLPALLRFIALWVGLFAAGTFVGLFLARVMMGIFGSLPSTAYYVLRLVVGAVMFWALFLRTAPMLVGAALGKQVGLVRAWDLTAPMARGLAVATVVIYVASAGISVLLEALVGMAFSGQVLLWSVICAAFFMVVHSVMTVTYGVAVQRRSLD